MKGIILAGGNGTRLAPITNAVSKQLLPVGDKPMVYYPLSVLMLANINDILLICNSKDLSSFKRLLGDGSRFGITISYQIQKEPNGIAEAFLLAEDYIGSDNVALILGDNIFYGYSFQGLLNDSVDYIESHHGALIFGYHVEDPERFGVLELGENNSVISIEEKPSCPLSNYASVGLYFYDNNVISYAKSLKPSERGELEITDLNKIYLKHKTLKAKILGRGFAWLDTGTHKSLINASNFINTIEERQGLKIGCPEEVAFRKGWISSSHIRALHDELEKTSYGSYIINLIKEKK